jgi:hypothetical protein
MRRLLGVLALAAGLPGSPARADDPGWQYLACWTDPITQQNHCSIVWDRIQWGEWTDVHVPLSDYTAKAVALRFRFIASNRPCDRRTTARIAEIKIGPLAQTERDLPRDFQSGTEDHQQAGLMEFVPPTSNEERCSYSGFLMTPVIRLGRTDVPDRRLEVAFRVYFPRERFDGYTRLPVEIAVDTDQDGLLDVWETAQGVDLNDGRAGRRVSFAIGGTTLTAVTDADGVATTTLPAGVVAGTGVLTLTFAEDADYLASSGTATVATASSSGLVTAGTMRSADGGRGGFNVHGDGVKVWGELQFQNGGLDFHAHEIAALGISTDRRQAWFAGVGKDGRPFRAYVEDNGEPGRDDVFRLWVNDVLQNGDGRLSGGNVQIH